MWHGLSITDSGINIVPFVTTWMNLEGILSEQVRQRKTNYCMISFIWTPNKVTKLLEKEIPLMVTGGWERKSYLRKIVKR